MDKKRQKTDVPAHIVSLPCEVIKYLATFMEPIDLYMCKQTCSSLSDIDRGHSLAHESLSMVGTQFKLYNICAICHKNVTSDDRTTNCYGMFIHANCLQKFELGFYSKEVGVWILNKSTPIIPGNYKLVGKVWNPAQWNFHDNVVVGHKINFSSVLAFFNRVRARHYVYKHYKRSITVGNKTINVLETFEKNNQKWGSTGLESIYLLDMYAEKLIANFMRVELMFTIHTKIHFGGFGEFVDRYKPVLEPKGESIKKDIMKHNKFIIGRELRDLSRMLLSKFLKECDCRRCYFFLDNCSFSNIEYNPWNSPDQPINRIYESDDVQDGIESSKVFLETFLHVAREILHERKIPFIKYMDKKLEDAVDRCFWFLFQKTDSTEGLRDKMESFLTKIDSESVSDSDSDYDSDSY